MEPLANWNGIEMPLNEARVSVLDRAFLFGDAVYEVLRIYAGKPFLLREHMDRLADSLRELRIVTDVRRIEERMLALLQNSRVDSGQVYLQVTRGEAPRQHAFPESPITPNELIFFKHYLTDPKAAARKTGVKVITHPDLRWRRCDIKSVNLLANCLAVQAAKEAGCDEALLVTASGQISEGALSSVFAVKHGQLLTAPLEANILPGITRGFIVGLAEKIGVTVQETSFSLDLVKSCDELFLTSTTIEVLPVIQVDNTLVGTGHPGPIAVRLQAAYREFVEST